MSCCRAQGTRSGPRSRPRPSRRRRERRRRRPWRSGSSVGFRSRKRRPLTHAGLQNSERRTSRSCWPTSAFPARRWSRTAAGFAGARAGRDAARAGEPASRPRPGDDRRSHRVQPRALRPAPEANQKSSKRTMSPLARSGSRSRAAILAGVTGQQCARHPGGRANAGAVATWHDHRRAEITPVATPLTPPRPARGHRRRTVLQPLVDVNCSDAAEMIQPRRSRPEQSDRRPPRDNGPGGDGQKSEAVQKGRPRRPVRPRRSGASLHRVEDGLRPRSAIAGRTPHDVNGASTSRPTQVAAKPISCVEDRPNLVDLAASPSPCCRRRVGHRCRIRPRRCCTRRC